MTAAPRDGAGEQPMPKIISVDDHLIEPAYMFQSRLPNKYKDLGPRVVIEPQGDIKLVRGTYVEAPGDSDKMAAWWHYEDQRFQMKEMVACPGIAPEDVSMQGVTFDDIPSACYEPKARVEDMKKNHLKILLKKSMKSDRKFLNFNLAMLKRRLLLIKHFKN